MIPKKEKASPDCKKCGKVIPESKRSDAVYCSESCKDAEEKARYCKKNPDYVKRQRAAVKGIQEKKRRELPPSQYKGRYGKALALGYRSMLEVDNARHLESLNIPFEYEKLKIKYSVPSKDKTYIADITLPNGIIVETKGRFDLEDRKKHLLIKAGRPDLDIRFVFSNSKAKIRKGSPTSYGDWCTKNGFIYADKLIPDGWLQ